MNNNILEQSNLTLMGTGVKKISQMTLETQEQLLKSDCVLHLFDRESEVARILKEHHVLSRSLLHLYKDGQRDIVNYRSIYSAIVNQLSPDKSISFLVHGSPNVGVSLRRMLEKYCHDNGLTFKTMPGLSSIESIINDLRIDPIEMGVCIYDVNRLLIYEHPLNPHAATILYHICSIAQPNIYRDSVAETTNMGLLQRYLERYYDGDHRCILISSSTEGDGCDVKTRIVPVSELDQNVEYIDFDTSLVIPPIKRVIKNRALYEQLAGAK